MSAYPRFFRVRQKFDGPRVDDLAGTVTAELARLRLNERGGLLATVRARPFWTPSDFMNKRSRDAHPSLIPE